MSNGTMFLVLVLVVAAALVGGALLLGSPQDRAQAEAERIAAKAAAESQRVAAETAAAESRAALREQARDNAHARALEALPYAVAVVGGVVVVVFLVLVYVDLRRVRGQGGDDAVLLYLRRLELTQAEQWRVLAELTRRTLPAGDHDVIVYQDRGKR